MGHFLLLLANGLSVTWLCARLKSSPRPASYPAPRSPSISAHTSIGRI